MSNSGKSAPKVPACPNAPSWIEPPLEPVKNLSPAGSGALSCRALLCERKIPTLLLLAGVLSDTPAHEGGRLLAGGAPAHAIVSELLARPLKAEQEGAA